MSKASIIDEYFRELNVYPWVAYVPIGELLVAEAKISGLWVYTAAALVEQESYGKNIFGCDWNIPDAKKPPFCQVAVTKLRVKALIKNYYTPPIGGANGTGLTQLTSIEYVKEAERLGGAHLPSNQMRVGFRVLNDNIVDMGFQAGAAAYNAGRGNWRMVYDTYGAQVVAKQHAWYERFN